MNTEHDYERHFHLKHDEQIVQDFKFFFMCSLIAANDNAGLTGVVK